MAEKRFIAEEEQREQRPSRWLSRALLALVVVYGSLIFLLWLIQWVLSEETPGLGVVKSALHLMLLPSLALALLCLLLGRWRLVLALVPALIAFLISFGGFFLPRGETGPTTAPTLRVLSFNIQAPDEAEMPALAEILRLMDADLVALQEVSPAAATYLEGELAGVYPYFALHPQQDYVYAGQGVLSKYPIVADEYWRYTELDARSLGQQRTVIAAHDREITLYNAHPVPPFGPTTSFSAQPHHEALDALLTRVLVEPGPVLLAGDFNMTDQFHAYRRITAEFDDAYRAVGEIGFGFTFPHREEDWLPPLLRLDYIFYSEGIIGRSAGVGDESAGSDHAPVWAEVAVP